MERISELEAILQKDYGNIGAVLVRKQGKRVYEYYQNDATQKSPFHVFSITKSILSMLFGIAIEQGKIKSLDQKILEFFPDYVVKKREKTIQTVTLRDMMTMTGPYKYRIPRYAKYFKSDDWVKASLDLLGGKGKVGKFRYAPVIGPDIFSGILVNATGKSVLEFARETLFTPLGIEVQGTVQFDTKEEQMEFYKSRTVTGWVAGPTGVHTGGWGLMLTPEDMEKLGALLCCLR